MHKYMVLYSKKDGVDTYTVVYLDEYQSDILYVDNDFGPITSRDKALSVIHSLNAVK